MYVAGFDRGVRPIGVWSMSITLSKQSIPSTSSCAPGFVRVLLRRFASALKTISLTSVDLPEPETPVRTQLPDGELHVDVLQVVLTRADDPERAAVLVAARRYRDPPLPGKELPRDRAAVARHVARRAFRDHLSPVLARAGPHVDEPVGGAHLLVVLDDEHGVAEVAKPLERPDEPSVVALVEPDRGLVEDVEHPHELRPDLRREPEPLRLPPPTASSTRSRLRYPTPTSSRNVSRSRISLRIRRPISSSVGVSSSPSTNRRAAVTDSRENSWIDLSPTVTASTSGLSRAPWHTGQGRIDMYSSIRSRCWDESVSR